MKKIEDFIQVTVEDKQAEESVKPAIDSLGRAYATGKRKNSIARVWLKPGKGEITVNKRKINNYFGREALKMIIKQPLAATKSENMDILATVTGGGLSGQAGAIRHAISKALTIYDPNTHGILRTGGFLTRDSRVVERKKYGKKKARRSFQFSKR